MRETSSFEKILKSGKQVETQVRGYSMYPFLFPQKTWVRIRPVKGKKLKRGDVVLYRRETGLWVLHRIVRTDGKWFYMAGDNQTEIEGPVSKAQIFGWMSEYRKDEKWHSVYFVPYWLGSRLWLKVLPVRGPISKWVHKLRRIGKGD